jgi:hypothetical protein
MDDFRSLAEPRPWMILLAGSLVGGALALLGGFRPEWDLLNYHLYNPHAWLHGRAAIDVAPAQLQSYLNPLFHLPHYLAFRYLSAGVLVFATGAVQGSQLLLLYLLLKQLLGGKREPVWLLLATALLAYPFVWLIDPLRVWEMRFRDLRVVALYPLLLVLPVCFWRRLAAEARAAPGAGFPVAELPGMAHGLLDLPLSRGRGNAGATGPVRCSGPLCPQPPPAGGRHVAAAVHSVVRRVSTASSRARTASGQPQYLASLARGCAGADQQP